jgi:hypothetical protein
MKELPGRRESLEGIELIKSTPSILFMPLNSLDHSFVQRAHGRQGSEQCLNGKHSELFRSGQPARICDIDGKTYSNNVTVTVNPGNRNIKWEVSTGSFEHCDTRPSILQPGF